MNLNNNRKMVLYQPMAIENTYKNLYYIQLSEPFYFENPEINVIVIGNLSSEFDINFKVNNFINLGTLITTKDVIIDTNELMFQCGFVSCKIQKITCGGNFSDRLDLRGIEKIRALGIELGITEGNVTIDLPSTLISY